MALPLLLREIGQFVYLAPVFLRHQGDEELREVQDRVFHAEGEQGEQEQPLIPAEVAYIRQNVVEALQLELLLRLARIRGVYGILQTVRVLHRSVSVTSRQGIREAGFYSGRKTEEK